MNRSKCVMLEKKLTELEVAYIASMFETLMECSDENQRWYYHAARNAARIYSKNLIKKLRKEKVTTNSDEWICRYLNYVIIVLQNAGTLIFKKHKIDRMLFDNHNIRVYKPMTDEELADCRKFFGSSFVDNVLQDERSIAKNNHGRTCTFYTSTPGILDSGNDIGFEPRMEILKDGTMRLISVDLCRKEYNDEDHKRNVTP